MIDHPLSDDARLTDSAKGTACGSATNASADVSPAQTEQTPDDVLAHGRADAERLGLDVVPLSDERTADVNDGGFGEAAYCHHRHHLDEHSTDFDTCPHRICQAARVAAQAEQEIARLQCKTHGDPLVCLACEAEEDARPEWQIPHRVTPPRLRGEPPAEWDRLVAQAHAISETLHFAGVQSGTLHEGVTALVEQRDQAEQEIATLKAQTDVGPPGRWTCPTCGFILTKAFLRASDGAVGVDARPVQDICPNDGSSLRQVTWKEDAEDANRVGLEQMKRAEAAEQALAALRALSARWHAPEGNRSRVWPMHLAEELDAVLRSPVERTRDEENDDLARRDTHDSSRPRSAASTDTKGSAR